MDPITIGMLAGAGMGLLKGNANVKKQVENDKYRKMAIAMSPWTGMGDPGALNLEGPVGSAAQGAAMGGQVGGMFGGGAGAAPAAATAAAAPPPNAYAGGPMDQMNGGYGGMGSPGAFGGNQLDPRMFKYTLMG